MVDLYQEFANSRFFHEERIDQRSVDALIGIAAGVAADGRINQQEAEFIKSWIESHLDRIDDPVVNILYRRLADMLKDGVLDQEESTELLEMLGQLSGTRISAIKPFTASTTLPLNNPPPLLTWTGKVFMFTGVMAYGPRTQCEALVVQRGGIIGASVSKKVNFLVIGSIGNEQWLHTSYGTKIKKAVSLRESGAPLALVSEKHWQESLFG
jgi:NAD-dependent DNA ligase